MENLTSLRDRLDQIDAQITSLLDERMTMVGQIGQVKYQHNLPLTDKGREGTIVERAEMQVQHPVLKESIGIIFQAIIEGSKISQQFFKYPASPFRRVGIIGLGLMGGSICKAIKLKDPTIEIATMVHSSEDYVLAIENGCIDRSCDTLVELMEYSEVIILASPISSVVPLAEEIQRHRYNARKLLVIDIASVKENIVEAFEKLSDARVEFVGTHPMAGTEKRGFANGQATLFVGRPWVVVPHGKNCIQALQQTKAFIRFLGAEPLDLDADVHDQRAALVSHIPGILSKSVWRLVQAADPASLEMAGPGFHSFTRLAHGNREMRAEIEMFNQKFIRSYLDCLIDQLTIDKELHDESILGQ